MTANLADLIDRVERASGLREAIARAIDPEAWEEYLLEDGRVDQEVASIFQDAYEESLAKSDNVLGLIEAAWNTRLQALEGAWRPISEAPRDGTKIDVWSRDARYTDVFWSDIQEWWCIEGDYGPEEPTPLHVAPAITHFKSLPDPPRDEPIDGENSREAKPILPNPIEGRGP